MEALPVERLERMADPSMVLAYPQRLKIVEILRAATEAPAHDPEEHPDQGVKSKSGHDT